MIKEITSDPPAALEYVRLPDKMPPQGATASYDATGKPDEKGSVIISSFGVQFIWARFRKPVKAGQVATMVLSNMPRAAVVMDGAATEWDPSADQPTIGDAVVELVAVERGLGVGRVVCRNTYKADVHIAVGVAAPIVI
jgi:hypothetical protein